MRKLLPEFILAFLLLGCIAYAATEIESINVDFAHKNATAYYEDGSFGLVNDVNTNGDKIESNAFMPSGATTTVQVTGNAFTQLFGGLIKQNAVNMDAVTNATIGQTGVYIASTDEQTMNVWKNGTY